MDAANTARIEAPLLTRQHLVVCVDDDAAVLSALRRLLRSEPYEFLPTDNPDTAMDVIRSRDVSLIIADYRMPAMSGTGLLQLVKSSSPSTVRLLLTGYPRATWVIQAQERELMHLVFGKPWDNEELKRTIISRLRERELSDAGRLRNGLGPG